MGVRRCRYRDEIEFTGGQRRFEISKYGYPVIIAAATLLTAWIGITDPNEFKVRMRKEIAHEIRAPIAVSDHAHSLHSSPKLRSHYPTSVNLPFTCLPQPQTERAICDGGLARSQVEFDSIT
jgi:hypothetical protein